MPLIINKKVPVGHPDRIKSKPKKFKPFSRAAPRIKMADEVPYEMEKVQKGLLHNPKRFKLVR